MHKVNIPTIIGNFCHKCFIYKRNDITTQHNTWPEHGPNDHATTSTLAYGDIYGFVFNLNVCIFLDATDMVSIFQCQNFS